MKVLKKFFGSLLLVVSATISTSVFAGKLSDLNYFVSSGNLARAMAKEICSCVYVNQIDPETCLRRNHVPRIASDFLKVSVSQSSQSVRVDNYGLAYVMGSKPAVAKYSSQPSNKGCTLVQ